MFGVIADYEPDQDVGVNGACFLRMYFRIAQGNERPSTRLHGNERRQHDPDEGSLLSLAIYRHFIYIIPSIRKVTGQQALGEPVHGESQWQGRLHPTPLAGLFWGPIRAMPIASVMPL